MKYRVFKHNGDVLDRVDGSGGDDFGSTDERAITEVAEALGVPEKEITVEERSEPPTRFDKTIPQPPPVVQPPTAEERLAAALAILASSNLDAATKAALAELA